MATVQTVMVETDTKSEMIVSGFIRDAEKIFEIMIPTALKLQFLLYYDSLPLSIKNMVCQITFVDEDDNSLEVVSIRYLESFRFEMYKQHCGLLNTDIILAVECIDPNDKNKEIHEKIVQINDKMNEIEVIEIEDKCTMEDLSPSRFVEYTFYENGPWFLSFVALESFLALKQNKFTWWLRHIFHSSDSSSLRRLLRIGIRIKMHDRFAFPSPKSEESEYKVQYKASWINIPRSVHKCRIWSARQRCYVPVDCHLDGAPKKQDVDKYWSELLDKLGKTNDKDCINNIITTPFNVPKYSITCICGLDHKTKQPLIKD